MLTTSLNQPTDVGAFDVDGDGIDDVVACSDDEMYWYDGTTAVTISTTLAGGTCSLAAGDVDADSDLDILVNEAAGNTLGWIENADQGTTWTVHTVMTGTHNSGHVFVADVDGDADVDAIYTHVLDDTITWYENGGASLTSATAHTISGDFNMIAVSAAGDIDGDTQCRNQV